MQTPFNPNPRDCGGPENSLNLWGEGEPERGPGRLRQRVLADAVPRTTATARTSSSRLHHDGELQGLASLEAALKAEGASDLYGVIHDFQSMVLLDKIVGDAKHSVVLGVPQAQGDDAEPALDGQPGQPGRPTTIRAPRPTAPTTCRCRTPTARCSRARDLRSLTFAGAKHAAAAAAGVDDRRPTTPTAPGNPVLWSGNANNTDASAVTPVTVPTADPTLRFLAKYGAEFGFDYGYVQVSTDGGATYTTIPGDKTVDAPLGPGLNGTTTGFEPHTYDLSAYAGQTVLVGFRYVSDGGVNEGGLLRRRHHRRRHDWSATARASRRSSRRPRSTRSTVAQLERRAGRASTRARSPVVLQVEFNGTHQLSLNRSAARAARAVPRRSSRSWPTTSRPSRSSSTRRTPSR